jgi:hypothetical protein
MRNCIISFLLISVSLLLISCASTAGSAEPFSPPAQEVSVMPEAPTATEVGEASVTPETPVATEAGETSVPQETSVIVEVNTIATELADTDDSLEDALNRSCAVFLKTLPETSIIAVVNIASIDSVNDKNEAEFAREELLFIMLNAKRFSFVERGSLEHVLTEQQFQLSGEVDDDSAVSIGHLTGAGIVITGSISLYDTTRYLRLKALDVETGTILAVTSERFKAME